MKAFYLLIFLWLGVQPMYAQFTFPASHTTSQTFTCIGCSVSNASQAYDNNANNYASLHVGLSLVSAVTLDLTFSPAIPANSVLSLVVEDPGASFSLASDVSYDLLSGSSPVGNAGWTMSSYGSSATKYVLSTVSNGSFNHLRITLAGVLTTSKTLNVYEVASSSTVPLPVQLLSFTGKVLDYSVQLGWISLTETDHAGTDIQKSPDGLHWTALDRLPPSSTGHTTHTYQYTDTAPLYGTNYYRLQQVSHQGTSTYSRIIQVKYQPQSTVQVYPNPVVAHQPVVIDFAGTQAGVSEMGLYDASGRRHDPQAAAIQHGGKVLYHFPQGLASGLYFLHIRTTTQEIRQKVWVP